MRETDWNPSQTPVLTRKLDCAPTLKTGRAAAKINEYIEHFAAYDAYQLALRFFYLIMQAAQHTALGIGMVILDELVANTDFLKNLLIVAFEEKAPIVRKNFGFKDQSANERSIYNFHESVF